MPPNSKDKWVRRFLITETTRHKKGFTVYKVTSVIYPKSAPEAVSRVSIWKRYNEFRKLHSELISRHDSLRIKESFPAFPKPKFFGRFEAEVIEERRQCAIRLLEFIARHTPLFTSNVFVKFFETGQSKDSMTTDSSLSLSSDTSEDDRNINSALRGTNYTPTPFSYIDDNRDRNNPPPEIVDNDKNDGIETHKHKTDDNFGQDLSKNNNNLNGVEFGVEKTACRNRTEIIDKEEISLTRSSNFGSFIVNDGSDLPNGIDEEFGRYILVAAAHMSAAFRHEAVAEFEEAFTQYKLGISSLLNGVQGDPESGRREMIKEKISKYLERAEKLYNRHLNCNISVLSKPADELRNYKVLRVVGSVMLVRDTERECNRVIKTVQKPAGSAECLSDYILRGKIPFMVRLYGCIETESTVFLVLQHASGGKLWEYMKSYHKGRTVVSKWCQKGHTRSASCEAIIQSEMKDSKKIEQRNPSPDVKKSSNEIQNRVFEAVSGFETEDNLPIDPDESLRKLEEEFGANCALGKTVPTTDLLAKSQELLRSVEATIKKSNSIASRLNESESLLYCKSKPRVKEENNSSDSEGVSSWKSSIDEPKALRVQEVDKVDKEKPNSNGARDYSQHSSSLESETSEFSESDESREAKGSSKLNGLSKPNNEIVDSDQFQSLVAEDSGIEMDDELWKLPEGTTRFWAAEILCTLEALHQQDVIIGDLKPDNILLGNGGHVAMSYVVPRRSLQFLRPKKPYSAPELCMFLPNVTPSTSADVWSYGVLLYELFTGIQFKSKHPGPFHSHSILNIPEELSSDVQSLISNVLRYKPEERLTIPEIKDHPFFAVIDWTSLANSCFT